MREHLAQVDADDVEVSVKQGDVVLFVRKKDRTFLLTPKDGEVEFFDPATGVRLLTKALVTIVRDVLPHLPSGELRGIE